MKKLLLTTLTLFLLVPVFVFAYTSPGSPDGFVNDFADVLSSQTEAQIEERLLNFQNQTNSQIAVVTIPELVDETIETYAVRLFEEWGVGQEGQDNGALFLVAIADRKLRIEVGYGLEGQLTDIESRQIVSNIVAPRFQENDFDSGISEGVLAITQAIESEDIYPQAGVANQNSKPNIDYGFLFWIGIFVFMWLGSVLSRSRSWWLGGVLGAGGGVIIGLIMSIWFWLPILVVAGLLFDYLVSTKFKSAFSGKDGHRHSGWLWFIGGGPHWWDRGGRGGGGFGGFGGGMSGGGGASGDW